MYKVVLVDDERWAMVDILHTFPFAQYGFEVVGQFTNAPMALERTPELAPDVLMADIRMPSLSGLELLRLLRERLPRLTAIILSGYAEFAYAQGAIKLEVFDYCLKPMDEVEAETLLVRLKRHLDGRSVAEPPPQETAACTSPQFARLLAYTDAHIFEKLVLDDLARQFFMNPSYCGQLFKSATGKGFSQYVRDARMQRACELLIHSQMPVAAIARSVGYEDIHYFTRLFTGQFGRSPRQYRGGR